MNFQILNSNPSDIDSIFNLYELATEFQKTKFRVHWPRFERSLVETEITEKRQWKLIIDDKIACVWATTFSDPQIWEERDADPSVYIHRIATNPGFRGQNFVKLIVEWSKGYAAENNKLFIRLDTIGDNLKLINHYIHCGFDFLGLLKLKNTEGLPKHYDQATVSLFQIALKNLL
jgi:ribosomal protein S18 acetylase RimI-like enzyme